MRKRAAGIHRQLQDDSTTDNYHAHSVLDHVSAFAMAVNEEKASGIRRP